MAMSRDRGTAKQPVDQLYGLVCDAQGRPYPDLLLAETNQEQGIIKLRAGSGATLPDLPLGTKLRILPNHACATCAQHEAYEVVRGASPESSRTGNVSAAGEPRLDGIRMDLIYTPDATPPAGHYSQAVRASSFVFVSGQLGFLAPAGPGARPVLAQGAAAQAEAALRSMEAILLAADSSLAAVVNVTVYVRDVGLWDEVNRVYERRFGAHKPAAPSCRPANCITARWLKSAPSRWRRRSPAWPAAYNAGDSRLRRMSAMQYEYLFWSMAAVVAAALAGGALCGRLGSVKRTLIGVAALAVAIFVAVLVLSRLNGFADLAAMLSIAAFMFGLVIAAAASLLTRRILLRRAER